MLGVKKLVERLVAASSDEELLATASAFSGAEGRDPALIAALAAKLAQSGITLPRRRKLSGDVASTGGPGSLSTLLGPLYLVAAGADVPALGIPGRPAGGIDCLAQIPGYRTRLSEAEVTAALDRCGYAHFLPTDALAPLDKRLFAVRQRNGLQAVPPLVIASLLSKKLAVGLSAFTIDVRVMPGGNFGATWEEATANAQLFRETAAVLGLSAATVLSDCRFPQQPFIGRREALWALREVFAGRSDGDLGQHAMRCRAMAQFCLPAAAVAPVSGAMLRRAFAANLAAQRTSDEAFEAVVADTAAAHDKEIVASAAGYFGVDLQKLRTILVRAQEKASLETAEFPDPIGLRLLKHPGEFVVKGEPVATVRAAEDTWSGNRDGLEGCVGAYSAPAAAGFEGVL